MLRALKGLFRLLRRNQNLLCVVVAFGTTLGLAAVSGYWLFYRAAYVFGGLVPVCFVWARAGLRKLEGTVVRAAGPLPAGPSVLRLAGSRPAQAGGHGRARDGPAPGGPARRGARPAQQRHLLPEAPPGGRGLDGHARRPAANG